MFFWGLFLFSDTWNMNINKNGSSFIKGGPGVTKQRCSAAIQSIPHLLFSQCSHCFSKLVFERSWKNVPASPGIWPPLTTDQGKHQETSQASSGRGRHQAIIHHLLVSHWKKWHKSCRLTMSWNVLPCESVPVATVSTVCPRRTSSTQLRADGSSPSLQCINTELTGTFVSCFHVESCSHTGVSAAASMKIKLQLNEMN